MSTVSQENAEIWDEREFFFLHAIFLVWDYVSNTFIDFGECFHVAMTFMPLKNKHTTVFTCANLPANFINIFVFFSICLCFCKKNVYWYFDWCWHKTQKQLTINVIWYELQNIVYLYLLLTEYMSWKKKE